MRMVYWTCGKSELAASRIASTWPRILQFSTGAIAESDRFRLHVSAGASCCHEVGATEGVWPNHGMAIAVVEPSSANSSR